MSLEAGKVKSLICLHLGGITLWVSVIYAHDLVSVPIPFSFGSWPLRKDSLRVREDF